MSFHTAMKRAGYGARLPVAQRKENEVFKASNLIVEQAVGTLLDHGLTTPKDFAGTPSSPAKSIFQGIHTSGSMDTVLWTVLKDVNRCLFAIPLSFVDESGKKYAFKVSLGEVMPADKAETWIQACANAIRAQVPSFGGFNRLDATGRLGLPEESKPGAGDGMNGETACAINSLAKTLRNEYLKPLTEAVAACRTREEVFALLQAKVNPPKPQTQEQAQGA